MSKRFAYFESCDGGMESHYFSGVDDIPRLWNWMRNFAVESDERLIRWVSSAEIGDLFEHRLGVAVRLGDEP